MNDDLKAWYQSRTVWGALVAILASLAHAAGVEVTAGDEGELADLLVAAVGAAAGVNPIAVVVLDGTVAGPTGVQVHLLKKKSELSEVVGTLSSSLVPQVIDAITSKRNTVTSSPVARFEEEIEPPSSES